MAANQARVASPRNERRWMRRIEDNYPSRPLRQRLEGTVGIYVEVTVKGRATNCEVTSTSGSELLDQAACNGALRYARFNPALDAMGRPISGSFATQINYELPKEADNSLRETQDNVNISPPPPAPPAPVRPSSQSPAPISQARQASPKNQRRWAQRIQDAYPLEAKREGIEGVVGVRVAVTPQGRVGDCQVVSSSGSHLLDGAPCKAMRQFARFNPALDRAGNPTSGTFSTRVTYVLSPADKEWAKEEAKIEAELAQHRGGTKEYDEALAWLDASKLFVNAVSTGEGSAVFIRGFVDERQLSPERLKALNEGSIKPNLILTKPEETTREPIRIVRSRLQSGVPEHCVMLMQVHRSNHGNDWDELVETVDGAPFRTPSFALDDACQSNTPWGEGTKPGDPFELNGAISFTAEGGYVRIDESLSCDGLEDVTSGRFTLSTYAIAHTEFFTNVAFNPGRPGGYNWLNTRHFSEASRFFIRGVTRTEPVDVREVNLVFDPNVVGDKNDISQRITILNDDGADQFCIVTRVEQGTSVFRRVLRLPREGRRLRWNKNAAGSFLRNPPEIREFAEAIGAEFRALASVEPNS